MYSLSVPKVNNLSKSKNIEIEIKRMMDTYGNDVLRTAYMFFKDYHKAEDAFQKVFVKVFRKYEGFKGERSEKTWIINGVLYFRAVSATGYLLKRGGFAGEISSGFIMCYYVLKK